MSLKFLSNQTTDNKIGIGTNVLNAKLSLYDATEDVSINVNTGLSGSYPKKTGISFGATSTSLGGDAEFTGGAGIQAINTAASGNPTDLTFWTNSSGTPAERMRIDAAGNVGIGTTGPNVLLQLRSNINTIPANTDFALQSGKYIRFLGASDGNGDYGSYLYAPSNGIITLGTRWTSTDEGGLTVNRSNVGIGTTGPIAKLHVNATNVLGGSSGNFTILSTLQNSGGSGGNNLYENNWSYRTATGTDWPTWSLWNGISVDASFVTPTTSLTWHWREPNAGKHHFGSGGTNVMTIGPSNVGIGTTTPGYLLDISKTAVNDTYSGINLQASNYGYTIEGGLTQNVGGELIFSSNNAGTRVPRVKFASNGNVGIGTTSPNQKLSVKGVINSDANDDYYGAWLSGNSTAGSENYLGLGPWYSQAGYVRYYDNDRLSIYTYDATEDVTLQEAGGNVGIGTTSPGAKLDVKNDDGVSNGLHIIADFNRSAGTDAQLILGYYADGSLVTGPVLYAANSKPLLFAAGGTEKMRISTTGAIKFNAYDSTNLTGTPTYLLGTDASGNVVKTLASGGGAAPQTSFSRGGINSSTYTMLFTASGGGYGSLINMTVSGTSGNVVVSASFEIIVNHSQDIHVRSMSGDYTLLTLRITSDNNATYSVEAKHNGSTTTTVAVCVQPQNNDTITPTTTDPGYTGAEYIHTATEGWRFGGEDNNVESSNVIVDGKIGIGAIPVTESNLSLGGNSTTEGGHLVLNRGTSQTEATHLDNVSNYFRIMGGTDSASGAVDFSINHTNSDAFFAGDVGIGGPPLGNPGTDILSVGVPATTAGGIQLWAGAAQTHYLQFGDANSGGEVYRGAIGYAHASETLLLLQGSVTALSFTGSQVATFANTVNAPTFVGNLTGNVTGDLTGIVTATSSLANGVVGYTQADSDDSTLIATTAFVQNLIDTIPAGLVFQGTWNAATNTPTLTSGSGTTGNFYIVSTSGSTNLDGITDWVTGDWAVFVEVGATDSWQKIDNSSVLDGSGTGQTVPLWSGSGTSNTLTNSIITQGSSLISVNGALSVQQNVTVGATSVNSSTTNYEYLLRIQGKNNFSDGTTWYGNYGQLILHSDSNMTGSARRFLMTSALSNNKFAIVRSVDSNTDPVVDSTASGVNSGTADFVIDNSGKIGIGEENPKAKLNITGVSAGPSVPINTSSAGIIRIESGNGGQALDIGAQGASPYSMWMQVGNASNSTGDTYPILLNPLGGNVGVGTLSPSAKLSVDGVASMGLGSRLSMGILDINSGSTPTQILIQTTIPFNSGAADFTVNIKGFVYGTDESCNLSIHWHYYNSVPYNANITSSGSWAPIAKLHQSSTGFVQIHLLSPGYWPKIYVESMYSSYYNDLYASGWSWSDAAGTGTAYALDYNKDFGNNFVMTDPGNVGIGIGSPGKQLTVRSLDNATNTFAGFYALNESQSLEIGYAGIYSGGTNANVDMNIQAKGTGNVLINGNGKVGIGTTLPFEKLDVVGKIYAQDRVISANVSLPNENLLPEASIKISNLNDIYVNATKTVISPYEARYVNDNTGGTTIRATTATLVSGVVYTVSIYYKDLIGSLTMDLGDTAISGNYKSATGTASVPTSGRIYGYAIRNSNNYEFIDINLSQAGSVTLLNIKLEQGTVVTEFIATPETQAIPQTITTNNLRATGSIQMGADDTTATADKVGTQRYRTGTEYVDVTGTELVTNGDFATDSGWTKGTGWTISGGTANAATTTSDFTQTVSFTLGQTYRLTYTVSNYSAGTLQTNLGAYTTNTPISANGSYTDIFTPTNVSSNSLLYFYGPTAFAGSIDNVSLMEVTAEDASYADMCMQTGSSTYEWVNIVRNTY